MPPAQRSIFSILVILSITQLMGWGTISLPAVLGEQFARDLGISLPGAFAGTAVMLVVSGFISPLLSSVFVRYGARLVMSAGSLAAVPGFFLLSMASGPLGYYAGWVVLGVAGACMLSVATYILLNEIEGPRAKRSIGALMLVTGLSSSIFWPITAGLSGMFGWRTTVVIYGVSMLLICFPLHYYGLPLRRAPVKIAGTMEPPTRPVSRLPFVLLTCVIMLNGFVSWGISAIIIQLLKSMGVDDFWALWIGSLLGVLQAFARVLDFFGGARWDGLATGLVAGIVLPLSFLSLIVFGPTDWSIAVFILLYGTATGAMAVARATMPLVFYDREAFARVSSQIALPANLAGAAAPPALAAILTSMGSNAVLLLALSFTLIALGALLALVRTRRAMQV
ncbi:MAG: MFS transporter [Hyphomicrobiales bacterium]|nr:MAG: MFS transporter [Hyphomicrobiales bacterium]